MGILPQGWFVAELMVLRVMKLALVLILAALVSFSASLEAAPSGAIAPEWEITDWLNGDPGALSDHRGKVILIDFFQLWCPGCRTFSVPLFNEWEERYGKRNDLLMVSIHTVFEGHDYQNMDRLRTFIVDHGIGHSVGVDAYVRPGESTPITMRRYRTGGTPHIVIVDRSGRIRFSRLGSFDPAPVEALIDQLLAEEPPGGIESTNGGNAPDSLGKR